MAKEEKAQEFARNCVEYNNLPIGVEHLLHTAFIVGYNERDDEEKNPWHKVSDGLPEQTGAKENGEIFLHQLLTGWKSLKLKRTEYGNKRTSKTLSL